MNANFFTPLKTVAVFMVFVSHTPTTFSQLQDYISVSGADALKYARLASAAYNAESPEGVKLATAAGMTLAKDGSFKEIFSGFQGATYYATSNPANIVISFAGTDFTNINVVKTDVDVARNLNPAQYQLAFEYVAEVKKAYPGAKIVVVGHSLGGGLAQYAAALNGLEGYTFNALGLNQVQMDEVKKSPLQNPITHFVQSGEPVADINSKLSLSYVGNNVVKVSFSSPISPYVSLTSPYINKHFIDPMVSGFSATPSLLSFASLGANPLGVNQTANSTPQTSFNSSSNVNKSGLANALATLGANSKSGALTYTSGTGIADYNTARGSVWQISGSQMTSWDFTSLGQNGKGDLGAAAITNVGATILSDGSTAYWGRWVGGSQITSNAGADVSGRAVSFAFGNSAVALPSGKFTYSYAGGTPFSSTSGSLTGTTYGGTISVDTSKQSVQVTNLRFGYLAGSSVGQATFNMNGSSTYNSTLRIPLVTLTGSCTGGSCGSGIASNGALAGRFIGAAGEGIGAVYGGVTNNNAVGGTAAGVFKR